METEIKIKVPEGMEIDEEHSTFECIRFRPKKITYDDVLKSVVPYTRIVNTTLRHHQKCVTFKKLLEVAEYLNGDWKPDWNNPKQIKYFISYDYMNKRFDICERYLMNLSGVFFSSRENARKAIQIIGEEELKNFFL